MVFNKKYDKMESKLSKLVIKTLLTIIFFTTLNIYSNENIETISDSLLNIKQEIIKVSNDSIYIPPQIRVEKPCILDAKFKGDPKDFKVGMVIDVLPDSSITNIRIFKSIPDLDKIAKKEIQNWKFTPALKKGKTVLDSLQVIMEFFYDDSFEETKLDSIFYNTKRLKLGIETLNQIQNQHYHNLLKKLPHNIIRENYHLDSPFDYRNVLKIDGFRETSKYASEIHLLQNRLPFYNYDFQGNQLNLSNPDYFIPVTFTEAYMVLGDYEMNQLALSMRKDYFLGVKHLYGKFDFLAQDGYWTRTREKSANFNLDLIYHLGNNKFFLGTNIVNQEIPQHKLRDSYKNLNNLEVVEEKNREYSFKWESNFALIGFQTRKRSFKIDNSKYSENQKNIFIEKDISLSQQNLTIRIDNYNFDDFASEFNFNGKINQVTHNNILYFKNDANFSFFSKIFYSLHKNFSIYSEINKLEDYNTKFVGNKVNFKEKKALSSIGCIVKNSYISFDTKIGNCSISQKTSSNDSTLTFNYQFENENFVAEEIVSFNKSFQQLDIQFFHQFSYSHFKEGLNLPKFQNKSSIDFCYNLEHNNKLRIGISNAFCGDYFSLSENFQYIPQSNQTDAYFAIQLTKLFQINLNVYNLLDSNYIFGKKSLSRHYNFSVIWKFLN